MLYSAHFASADDPAIDARTTALEDQPMPLEEIFAVCRELRIRARVSLNGDVVGTVVPVDELESSARNGL